jgi:hypothetical protein
MIRLESSRRGRASRGTRRRSKPASDLLRPISSGDCARRPSSHSPNATMPSRWSCSA